MKITTLFLALIPVAFLMLALSVESLIESRLFLSLSIISCSLMFRIASKPAPAPKQEQKQRQSYKYASQEH